MNYHTMYYLASQVSDFLDRSIGEWSSHQTYHHFNEYGVISEELWSNFTVESPDLFQYKISFETKTHIEVVKTGEISFRIGTMSDGEIILLRDGGFFTDKPTTAKIIFSEDKETLATETEYDGKRFVETISYATDLYRTRTIRAFTDNKLYLIGQYYESKVVGGV